MSFLKSSRAQRIEVVVLLHVRGFVVAGGDGLFQPGHGAVGFGVGLMGGRGGPVGCAEHGRSDGPETGCFVQALGVSAARASPKSPSPRG